MSFDLYVWHEAGPITADEALAKIESMEEGEEPSPFVVHSGLLAFHTALLSQFPALEDLPDGRLDEHGVWSVTPEASDSYIGLTIIWSKAARVATSVRELVSRHGLICYDPQNHVVLPNAPGYVPAFVLTTERLDAIPDPTTDVVERVARMLSNDNYFAILERADGWYAQVGYGESADVRPGTYAMEYREGSPDLHFRAVTTDIAAATRFLQEFLAGEDSWKLRHTWHRVAF